MKHILLALLLGILGFRDETGDTHQLVVEFYREELVIEMLTENVDNSLPHVGGWQHQYELAVVIILEGDVVMDERDAVKFLFNMGEFHLVGFEEVAAGGHVEEEVFDGDGGAVGAGDGCMFLDFSPFDEYEGAHLIGSGFGFELHMRDGGNGGESLAAKAQRAY